MTITLLGTLKAMFLKTLNYFHFNSLVPLGLYSYPQVVHCIRALTLRNESVPGLVWLSGFSAGLQIKGSPVQFPVRAHAWVAGQVPSR